MNFHIQFFSTCYLLSVFLDKDKMFLASGYKIDVKKNRTMTLQDTISAELCGVIN